MKPAETNRNEGATRPAPVSIRNATAEDFAALSKLMSECMQHYFGSDDGGDHAVEKLLKDAPRSVGTVIAFADSAPVGFASFAVVYPGPGGRGTLYMKDLFVSNRARSQNIGLHLMAHLAAVAQARDCIRFDWTAETTPPRALSFYDRIGAARVPEKVYFRLEGDSLQAFAKRPSNL